MLVKVLVYGYVSGGYSSRKMAKRLAEDVAFRVLAANNVPAHRTIRGFVSAISMNSLSCLSQWCDWRTQPA